MRDKITLRQKIKDTIDLGRSSIEISNYHIHRGNCNEGVLARGASCVDGRIDVVSRQRKKRGLQRRKEIGPNSPHRKGSDVLIHFRV